MTKKLLVVFGATGNQGNSVASHVLTDAQLSQQYSVRGITRNSSQPAAQALESKGSEIVEADLNDPSSLLPALTGAHTVFLTTNTIYGSNSREIEFAQAKAVTDTCIAVGAEYIIWSTSSPVSKLSNGTVKNVVHFDVKAEVEDYMRAKRASIKSAFFAPGSFMQNFAGIMRPVDRGDGTFVLSHMLEHDSLLPLIDVCESGKWVGAILQNPDKYEGACFAAAENLYSMDEVCDIMSRVSGKTVKHERVSDEEFKERLGEGFREPLFDMFRWVRDFGYYGPETREMVEWTKGQVKEELTGLERFLRGMALKDLGLE